MKTYYLFTLLLLLSLSTLAQNIKVSFSGTSSAVVIDSIYATNLATDESISLPGDATLILSSNTGISDLISNPDLSLVYPNPFPGNATIQTFSDESRNINISILDLSGRTIVQTTAFVNPGVCSFYLSLASPGIYFATLETSAGTNTHKLISTSSGHVNQIRHIGSNLKPVTCNMQLKSSFTLGFTPGDIIQYECFSSDFSTIFTDSPSVTKTYEIEFAPIAHLSISKEEALYDERITLDASGCIDAETSAEELEVRWDFDGDSIWDTEFDQMKTIEHLFPLAGEYNIRVQVQDLAGMTDSVSARVNIGYPFFTDSRDDNIYHYKRIGDQYWMVENLAYLPEVSPSDEGSLNIKHYYVYGYESSTPMLAKMHPNYDKYGVLYNWPAAMNGAESSNSVPSGVQGICPEGWHLPSDDEWKVLELHLGMSEEELDIGVGAGNNGVLRNSGSVGGKLKETGTNHWLTPNVGADNSSGFTSIPSGDRDSRAFFANIGLVAAYWSSTTFDNDDALGRSIENKEEGVYRYFVFYSYGLSVRCVKD